MDGDFAIIAAVAANPGCSLDLADHLEALGIAVPRSTLYRRLQYLIGSGLLRGERQRTGRGRPRRGVLLTAAGRVWLADEVSRALRTEPLDSPLFALALGCVAEVDRETLAGVLKPRVVAAAQRLTAEKRALVAESASAAYWARISRERHIAYMQADINWLESVLRPRTAPEQSPKANEAS